MKVAHRKTQIAYCLYRLVSTIAAGEMQTCFCAESKLQHCGGSFWSPNVVGEPPLSLSLYLKSRGWDVFFSKQHYSRVALAGTHEAGTAVNAPMGSAWSFGFPYRSKTCSFTEVDHTLRLQPYEDIQVVRPPKPTPTTFSGGGPGALGIYNFTRSHGPMSGIHQALTGFACFAPRTDATVSTVAPAPGLNQSLNVLAACACGEPPGGRLKADRRRDVVWMTTD